MQCFLRRGSAHRRDSAAGCPPAERLPVAASTRSKRSAVDCGGNTDPLDVSGELTLKKTPKCKKTGKKRNCRERERVTATARAWLSRGLSGSCVNPSAVSGFRKAADTVLAEDGLGEASASMKATFRRATCAAMT